MQTKTTVRGHPIHPMLIPFPIALYTVGLGTLIAYAATGAPFWYRVSFLAMLAGAAVAILAAIFGVIDVIGLPRSRARTLGVYHGGIAFTATVLFIAAGVAMRTAWNQHVTVSNPAPQLEVNLPLVLAAIGFCVLLTAGLIGWHLTGVHHVGITERGAANREVLARTPDYVEPSYVAPGDGVTTTGERPRI